jgi:nucleoside-diphosphate-sugar epimerase
MKIFVTGASGYIGYHVCSALRRAGHSVWGLTRSEANAKRLAQQEIHPVIGTMQEPGAFLNIAGGCSAIIHTAADYTVDTWSVDRQMVEAFMSIGNRGPQDKLFIYTSGVWLYGNTGSNAADETTPLDPPEMVRARANIEEIVMNATTVRPLIIRPGMVYGKQGGAPGMWFGPLSQQQLPMVVGDGDNFWTMVHVEDLAEAYLLAVEVGLSNEIFNITDRSRWRVRDMVCAAAKLTGFRGAVMYTPVDEAIPTLGPVAECLALDQHVDSRKAVRLLGWQPKHGGFVDDVDEYYTAWQGFQKNSK